MYALELETQIDQNHQIHLQLPEALNAQKVKVIVMYEHIVQSFKPLQLGLFAGKVTQSDDFNESLPDSFWLEGNRMNAIIT
jgi:hypothetical protein